MSIRFQVLINITVILVTLVIITFVLSRFLVVRNLDMAEEEEAGQHLVGVQTLLKNESGSLDAITIDWASWDDTYDYIEDLNEEYRESNILPGTLHDLNLSLILFINSDGEIVSSMAYDRESYEEVPLPAEVVKHFIGNDELFDVSEDGVAGFVVLPDLPPLLIASRPILPSMEDGPSKGLLIFGRFFGEEEVGSYNIFQDESVGFYELDGTALPADISELLGLLQQDEPSIVRELNDDIIAGYALIDDVYGAPSLVLRLEMPRDIYNQGRNGIMLLLSVLGGIGVIIVISVMLIADKEGLSRLRKLSAKVNQIGSRGVISERITGIDKGGKDEISSLTRDINQMLTNLQTLYQNEADLSRKLESEMMKRVDFTRALVHELRTPLTPILTTSEILLDEVTDEPRRSMVNNIYRGALRLNKRIEELLDLARDEVGGLQIAPTKIDPVTVIRETVEEMKSTSAYAVNHTCKLDIPDDLPALRADEDRIKQVLTNLLDNACKYTYEGDEIAITARIVDNELIVSIQDHGPGVSASDIEWLFDPYYRGEKHKDRVGGLGLGLPLCKAIIELHHGKIWVENSPGKGATFKFSLPLEPDPREGENNESAGN